MKPDTSTSFVRRQLRLALQVGLVCFVSLAGCNYSEQKQNALTPGGGPAVNDLGWLMTNLFHASCVSCHNGGRQPGGFRFESAADVMSQTRTGGITPGAAASSQVYDAIATGRMPIGGTKPSAATVEVLRCWIDAGAAEDSAQCAPKEANANPGTPGGTGGGNGGAGGQPGRPGDPGRPVPGADGAEGCDDDDHGDDHDDDRRHDDCDDDDDNGGGGGGNGQPPDASNPGNPGNPGGGDPGTPAVVFSQVAAILNASCVGCHGSTGGAADVSLDSFAAVTAPTAGPQLVTCGTAATSLLYQVLLDDAMPMGGDPLSAEQKQTVAAWIAGGCQP